MLVTQAMLHDVVFLAFVHLRVCGGSTVSHSTGAIFFAISLYIEQCYLMLFINVIEVKGGDSSGISCLGETPQ
jgi:hypothetical protein